MSSEKMSRVPRSSVNPETSRRLLSYLFKDYKFRFILVLILLVLNAYVTVSFSLFLQVIIDDFIAPLIGQANPSLMGLFREVVKMGVIAVIGIVSNWAYNIIMAQISQGILKTIRDEMFTHMQSLPIRYFDSNNVGDVMSYYTNDTDTLRQMLSQSIPQMISALITIVTVTIAMIKTNVPMTIFVALYLVMMLRVIRHIAGNSSKYFIAQQESIGKVNGYVEEMMEGQKVVKVFTREDRVKEDFDRLNDELENNTSSANRYANILMPTMSNLGNLQYILIAMIGGAMAIKGVGGLTLGIIATFLQLSRSVTMPLGRISQQLNMVVMALAGATRIFSFLDEKPEQDEGYITLVNVEYGENNEIKECERRTCIWAWKYPSANGKPEYRLLEGKIEFHDVDFSYIAGEPVLHDISLWAESGEKLAFVGATGAGKTTITNLINRFYDIEKGSITYDGIDIKDIKKSDLRRSLGMVLQETNLFTGTIAENIRYGRKDAEQAEVETAAQLANAHSFITRLPEGYDTMIDGSGESLSQGQRQLLSIARAAVADPPVMVLDEATSSIDTRTEILVQNGMDALMTGRTVFVIAHRLSTIKDSDVIMVMDMGRIVERGTHDELLERRGIYYQLYTGAFELS